MQPRTEVLEGGLNAVNEDYCILTGKRLNSGTTQ
jgi:hypothetical protein